MCPAAQRVEQLGGDRPSCAPKLGTQPERGVRADSRETACLQRVVPWLGGPVPCGLAVTIALVPPAPVRRAVPGGELGVLICRVIARDRQSQ